MMFTAKYKKQISELAGSVRAADGPSWLQLRLPDGLIMLVQRGQGEPRQYRLAIAYERGHFPTEQQLNELLDLLGLPDGLGYDSFTRKGKTKTGRPVEYWGLESLWIETPQRGAK